MLHSPELLVLDEPTVGLDLISKEKLRAFLARANVVEDITLLLTTHDLAAVAGRAADDRYRRQGTADGHGSLPAAIPAMFRT